MSALDEDTTEIPPVRGPRRTRGGRRAKWPLALVLVWAGAAVIDLVFFHIGTGSGKPAAGSSGQRPAVTAHRRAGGHRPRPTPSATSTPGPAPVPLTPASAEAFGPTGPGSGDNASQASLAIDDSTATAWKTAWYRSAKFGNLQDGTGLLIDMGAADRISRVQVLLGATPGADVQLFTGNVPIKADMRLSATVDDASGDLPLSLNPARRARYLLIWFTLLPPNSNPAGTFQASVYNVTVDGTR
jgi:hypothetical protein